MNLNKVIAGHIGTKNGTEILQLLNPYATIITGFNQVKPLYPTRVVSGRLGHFFEKVLDLQNALNIFGVLTLQA